MKEGHRLALVSADTMQDGGRVQRRRLRNRVRMMDVAEEMFATMPFAAVRIETIADAADVSVGTVYTHFENKDGLYLAVIERAIDQAAEVVVGAISSRESPLERATAIGEAYLQLLADRPAIARFLSSSTMFAGAEHASLRQRIASQVQTFYDLLAAEISSAVDRGEIRPVEPMLLAAFLVGAWTGMAAVDNNSITPTLGTEGVRAAMDQAISILIDGLRSNH